MYSYDLKVDSTHNWQAVVNTGVKSIVQLVHSSKAGIVPVLRCRFGAASTSAGFNLYVGDQITIDSTLYVKPHNVSRDAGVSSYTVNVTVVE